MSKGSDDGTAEAVSSRNLRWFDAAALASLVFFVVLVLGVLLTGALTAEVIFVALLPFVFYLVLSEKLTRIGGPGGVALEFQNRTAESVSPHAVRAKAAISNDELPEIERLVEIQSRIRQQQIRQLFQGSQTPGGDPFDEMTDTTPSADELEVEIAESRAALQRKRAEIRDAEEDPSSYRALSLRLGKSYSPELLRLYLTEYTGLRYVVFRADPDVFVGILRVSEFRGLLTSCGDAPLSGFEADASPDLWDELLLDEEDADEPLFPTLGELIESSRISEYDAVVTETLGPTVSRGRALSKMNRLGREYLPVVEDGAFEGVVTREELLVELFPLEEGSTATEAENAGAGTTSAS